MFVVKLDKVFCNVKLMIIFVILKLVNIGVRLRLICDKLIKILIIYIILLDIEIKKFCIKWEIWMFFEFIVECIIVWVIFVLFFVVSRINKKIKSWNRCWIVLFVS